MSSHFFVSSVEPGSFRYGENLPKRAVCHGRFANSAQAQAHAAKLKRDYLSPALDKFGNPLTPAQRAYLGVWHPLKYEQALARGRAHAERAVTA